MSRWLSVSIFKISDSLKAYFESGGDTLHPDGCKSDDTTSNSVDKHYHQNQNRSYPTAARPSNLELAVLPMTRVSVEWLKPSQVSRTIAKTDRSVNGHFTIAPYKRL